jgi:hypothetical protein
MRGSGWTARAALTLVAMLLPGGVGGCGHGPDIVTSIVFDDATHTITTADVICTNQPGDGLVILVQDSPRRTVRIHLTQHGRLVVQKVGLRHDDVAGFVEDSDEVTATKVDDTFTISGRMPPNPNESQWHTFKIQTTCPRYLNPPPPNLEPPRGEP